MKISIGHFAEEISLETGVPTYKVEEVLTSLTRCVRRALLARNEVLWVGVCKLFVQYKKARMYKHPVTGELCIKASHWNLKTKPSGELSDRVEEQA